jgi:hypothetical protein
MRKHRKVIAPRVFCATGARTRDLTVAASATFAAATIHLAYGPGTLLGLLAPPGRARPARRHGEDLALRIGIEEWCNLPSIPGPDRVESMGAANRVRE